MRTKIFTRRNLIIAIGILLGVALFAILLIPDSVPVETARATIGSFEETVQEDGTTRIREKFTVLAPVSGILRRTEIHPGDPVRKGERLATIHWDRDIAVPSPASGRLLRLIRENEGPVEMGSPIMEVGDPSSLEIVVDLLTADAVRVHSGTPVRIERWGGNQPLEGLVRVVEPAAYTKISALGVEEQRVNAIVRITSKEEIWKNLGDQFRVDCTFIVSKQENVLRVPSGALFRDGEGWALFRVENGKVRKIAVRISARSPINAVIQEGLKEGDEVVLYPGDRIQDGVRVKKI